MPGLETATTLRRVSVVLIPLLTAILAAGPPATVVTTGDSLTLGYSLWLQDSFYEVVTSVQVGQAACGGTNSLKYTGQSPDACSGDYRDFAADVLQQDPDVIVFMLGTNDAIQSVPDPNMITRYRQNIAAVFEVFGTAVNSAGRRPIVVVAAPIPIPGHPAADVLLRDTFNPWLARQAGDRGFAHLDLHAGIQQLPHWQIYYNDGVHLWALGGTGYQWMAETVRDRVLAALAGDPCRCRGDLTGDEEVTTEDLQVLLGALGVNDAGDLNYDGRSDLHDLLELQAAFGGVCPSCP